MDIIGGIFVNSNRKIGNLITGIIKTVEYSTIFYILKKNPNLQRRDKLGLA